MALLSALASALEHRVERWRDGLAEQPLPAGLARGPLDRTSGIQTYASVRREDGRKRMTIYPSPEAYSTPLRPARD